MITFLKKLIPIIAAAAAEKKQWREEKQANEGLL